MDRRELLLLRLVTLMGTTLSELTSITPAQTSQHIYRDRLDLPAELRPGMIVLDGSEVVVLQKPSSATRGGPAPSIMKLEPQILVGLRQRSPDKASEYGPELSAYRNAIYRAVVYDAEILDLIGDNGGVQYLGHETDMQLGQPAAGFLWMKFAFNYPLIPSELSL